MPMDYDDNDISHHNLRLVGEGRARSSSALRPYDFPKFDFDDSLQGHLRFDSLVETEVFLGIQSQEDNQWIEDFSRDSNGMEFNSTPADPCSISRRDNVWSEATSSESVDLLLKSVGQEEMMPRASIIQESDATVDQDTLSKLVESSNGKQKETNDAHGATSNTALLEEETLKNYLGSSGNIEEQLEKPLAPLAEDESPSGYSSKLNQNALCGNDGTMTDEGKYSYNAESTSEILEESRTSVEGKGDSLDFPSITEHFDSAIETLSTSKACQQVDSSVSHESCIGDQQDKHDSSKTELENAVILQGETGVTSIQTRSADCSPGLVPDSERENLDANLDSDIVKGEFELKSSERDDSNISFTTSIQNKRPENDLAVSNDMDKPFDNCQSASCMDVIVEDSAELDSIISGHCSSPKQLIDPPAQLPHKQDSDNMEDISVGPKCKSVSEMSLLSMEVNGASAATGESIDMALLSSAADHDHSEISEGFPSDTIATREDSIVRLLSDDTNIPMQSSKDNLDNRQADFSGSEKDMCSTACAVKEISGDLENIDLKNIGTLKNDDLTHSLEVREGLDVDFSIHKLIPQTSGESESGKKGSAFNSIKASTLSDVGQRETSAIGLHPDIYEKEVEMVEGSLQVEADNTSKVGVSLVETVQIPISDISAISQQPVENIEEICSNAPSLKEAMGPLSLDSKKSSLNENADLACGGETKAKEGEKESGQTADFDKTSCGFPTIISSSEPSQLENDNQEEGRGYQIVNEINDIQSTSEALRRTDLLGDDSGFSFKVNTSPDTIEKEPGKNWSPFPDVEKSKVLEETAPSSKGKIKRSMSHKTPRQNAKLFDGETGPGTFKGTSEHKGRRGSAKGTTKENLKKGSQSKTPNQENASLKVEKVSNSLLSSPSSTSHIEFGQMQQQYGNVEATSKKPFGVSVPTSNVPDLNASVISSIASVSSPTCRQPFSDLQQVQLRAQIFVYGSLIQGHVPDEAFMVSAFDQYEGGRRFWERIWRAAAERVENQKLVGMAETPHSQSGVRASDSVKQGSQSSKVSATPVSRAHSKENPATVLSPITLASPLWNISTPFRDSLTSNPIHKGPIVDFQQALTPVRPHQTPIRNYVSPWLSSPHTSSLGANVQFRPVTMTETVKLTPVKDTSVMLNSIGKHTTSSQAGHVVSPSPALREVSPIHDAKSIASAAQHSVGAKPRKRKKVLASDPCQVTGSKLNSNMASPLVIPDSVSTPSVPDPILSKPAANASTIFSLEVPKKSDIDGVNAVAYSEQTLSKIAEAKSEAENAAALSNVAVSHCEDLWAQLAKQQGSGLNSETEAKLASSAVAIAAAVSVAKAAAAAARIAYNAALQAKLMADNSLHSSTICSVIQSSGKFSSDVHDEGNATPPSKKNKNDTNESSAILVAAKEAAKRRVEAASAASRQAENLDAIVKAAELAAAAVSQAGKIVAMSEPLPLNNLIEAGPEGYWKLPQPSVASIEKVRDRIIDPSGDISSDKTSIPSAVDFVGKGLLGIVGKVHLHVTGGPDGLSNAPSSVGVMRSKHIDERDLKAGIELGASDTTKSSTGATVIDTPLGTNSVKNDCDDMATVDGIKEGSHIEVFNPSSAKTCAWYTANVLSVEKGKAYVCYDNLLSDKGNVKEWVPLESDGDKAPIIRTAHPSSALPYQRTGKRRRAALGDYDWCVGDRVDVWIDDGWWEGVVAAKNEKDETSFIVQLSAQGETKTVGVWNLRSSRSWINGKWIEWSSSKSQNTSDQSDAQLKRQKLDPHVSESKDKELNNLNSILEKSEQSNFLTLSTSEKMFDIGKTTTIDCNKHGARRPLRTNQQKEGSRVVFGVPKPTGKKRKFMDVSKHFSANMTDKSNEAKDTTKFGKYLMPQGAPSRGWKAPTRNDSKDKRIVESKPRVLSSRKAQRNLPQRDNTRSKFAQNVDISIDQGSHDDHTSGKSIVHGSGSFEKSTEAPLSSLLPPQSTTSRKIASFNSKTDRVNRGRLGPSGEQSSKIDDNVNFVNTDGSTLDVSEPRRSNRRTQPTHRLLEGLQSAMAIPKMPAFSHDKTRRNVPARGK